MAKYKG